MAVGKLLLQEQKLREQAKKLRDKITSLTDRKGWYYRSVSFCDDGSVTLCVSLANYLASYPDYGTPNLETFNPDNQTRYCRLQYPPVIVGEIAPGRKLYVEAWSDKFDAPTTTNQ